MLASTNPSAQPLEKYAVFFGSCTVHGDSAPCMAMRSFARGGRRFLLTVDMSTLATRVVDATA